MLCASLVANSTGSSLSSPRPHRSQMRALNATAWVTAAAGFLAFGLVASATYLLNDLHDLADDLAPSRGRALRGRRADGFAVPPHHHRVRTKRLSDRRLDRS